MANWQTPKVDWATEDGVMNTDFNRIEGNNQYLYDEVNRIAATMLASNVTIYVSTVGNDSTGTGESAAPFKTIEKAINSIPKNLNGFDATIHILSGTYSESIDIANYYGGFIKLTGPAGSVVISGLTVSYGSKVMVETITLTINGTLTVTYGGYFVNTASMTLTNNPYGVYAASGSVCLFDANVTISNTTTCGAFAATGSRIHLSSVSGSGNRIGLYASQGGLISYGASSLISNTISVTETGGRINTGAQTSSPGGIM